MEDLYWLLEEVQEAHPDVKGVSVGAILSDYQRMRVESVCGRLDLISLAYLWQEDQSQLLNEMLHCHLHAVVIKVGSTLYRVYTGTVSSWL